MGRFDYYDDYFPRYVSVGERKQEAAEALEKLRKKNKNIEPVIIEGNKIAKSWWGKSWCTNLERYADYSNRLPRGRNYARHGSVLDLKIKEGQVNALVQGSRGAPYKVSIKIKALQKKTLQSILNKCSGKIETMTELLEGKFPEELETVFTIKEKGLFPSPGQISFDCSCPDWADMCKHVAAVLYGIGARLDHKPELFFTLRKIDVNELVGQAVHSKKEEMLEKAVKKTSRVIDNTELSSMFGIDLTSENNENQKKSTSKKEKKKN